jgi:hypothetical protein
MTLGKKLLKKEMMMGDHNSSLASVGLCEKTGYPVSRDGHLLNTICYRTGEVIADWDKPGVELQCFTDPYCHLYYAHGSGDDFHCFDFEVINAGPRGDFIILHSTINSETGCFIQGGSYAVLPVNTEEQKMYAVSFAEGIVDLAVQWMFDNEVRATRRGWNQDEMFFVRSVASALFEYRFEDWRKNEPKFSDREFRFGGKAINKLVAECICKEGTFNDVLGASI